MIQRQWKPPLWVAFPDVSPEMWLRPHAWNDYAIEWNKWFAALSDMEQEEYQLLFPEPASWMAYYRFLLNRPSAADGDRLPDDG